MKKLEELFNLPTDVLLDEVVPESEKVSEIMSVDILSSIDKIESALPMVRGLESSDSEMDALATLATESYKDLMDLGMNVEARWSSEIFNSAGSMLGHAITARTAKINKKLKMIDLQLKKAKLDQTGVDQFPTEEGTILDRNELLERLINGKGDAS
ncbi:MAG: hypothetical protein HOK52_06805 [Candidatus Marinimicrobia bacterium]|jgi:hypothetical protein|nr:hypothetical protein [Candidatus Neomarinimicrobiota bacterium]